MLYIARDKNQQIQWVAIIDVEIEIYPICSIILIYN
jgi:hypothetical protein